MATTNTRNLSRNQWALVVLLGCGVLMAALALFFLFDRTPQIGPSPESFKTVDALYTAVRDRDEKRVAECQERLHRQRDAGALDRDAAEELDAIVSKALGGSWDSAAERLYRFMLAQRR